MKDLAGELGKRVFPDVEPQKSRRIMLQMITGILIALLSIAGMKIYSNQETKQQQRFQQIKGAEMILQELPEQETGETINEELQETVSGNRMTDITETDTAAVTFSYDWDFLVETNADIKGWLYLPDTPIDLPVVSTLDNDYYLSHDFWKQEKRAGCPFMDKDTDQWDFNKTIYAHNMSRHSDAMFSPLLSYKNECYFKAHRQLYYTECYGITAEYQIMAVVKYNIEDTESWDFRTRDHADIESYTLWMEQLQERSLYYAEPGCAPTEILTLSTCDRSEFGADGRLVIVAGKKDCS